MKNVVTVYKPEGVTPLQMVHKLRKNHPEYKDQKIAYAGRLDPMAEGLLLLLIGDECKNRKDYELLPKRYCFTVLFGIKSDSYDILGCVKKGVFKTKHILKKEITALLPHYSGTFQQEYPPFSSPRVNGKPLFYWARHNLLDSIRIPSKEITVYDFAFHGIREISREKMCNDIPFRIQKVQGNFRQKEVLEAWKNNFHDLPKTIPVADFTLQCSSGTYIRSLANDMGNKLSCGALAYSIKRTEIGDFSIEELNDPD